MKTLIGPAPLQTEEQVIINIYKHTHITIENHYQIFHAHILLSVHRRDTLSCMYFSKTSHIKTIL